MLKLKRKPQSNDRPVHDVQAGATLIEVLVALGILASAIVILITGLSTGSFAVRSTDTLTTASDLAAVQLESIKAANYVTGTAAYAAIPAPSGYTIAQTISYWSGSLFTSNPAADTTGMQWITVTVTFNGGSFKVSNYKVKR